MKLVPAIAILKQLVLCLISIGSLSHEFCPYYCTPSTWLIVMSPNPQSFFHLRNGSGLPVVYHPAYSAPVLPSSHRFPMNIFRKIYERLLETRVVLPEQVRPILEVVFLKLESGCESSWLTSQTATSEALAFLLPPCSGLTTGNARLSR